MVVVVFARIACTATSARLLGPETNRRRSKESWNFIDSQLAALGQGFGEGRRLRQCPGPAAGAEIAERQFMRAETAKLRRFPAIDQLHRSQQGAGGQFEPAPVAGLSQKR